MRMKRQTVLVIALMSLAVIGTLAYLSVLPANSKNDDLSWQTLGIRQTEESEYETIQNTKIEDARNKTIVYDVDILHKELLKIHDKLYEKKPGDTCKIREPTCVILGVAKSGTQELVDFASLHPDIVLKPGLAIPNMFDNRKEVRRQALFKAKQPLPCSYPNQTVVLKSDDFLSMANMPKKLYEFNPDLKMILITREPVSRAISGFSFHYFQNLQHSMRFEYKPELMPEMDHHFVNLSNGKVHEIKALTTSIYHTGMEQYLKVFPLDQILVLESNEFKDNPVKVLQRVEKFLNLKPVITNDLFNYVEDKGFYCLNSDNVYCYGSDRGRKIMKDLKTETMEILKEYFRPHNMKFFQQIGKQFDW